MEPIKIGIFDDHPYILEGIKTAINTQDVPIEIVFEAQLKNNLFEQTAMHYPDILILDIVSDEVSSLENFERLQKEFPKIKVIAFSSLSNVVLIENLLSYGVKGFVNKKQKIEDLVLAIIEVNDGQISVPEDYKFITSKFNNHKVAILSEREIEIISLIGYEFTTLQIADRLMLSVNTIESHRKRIFQKLNVKNVAGMIMEASRLGYLKT